MRLYTAMAHPWHSHFRSAERLPALVAILCATMLTSCRTRPEPVVEPTTFPARVFDRDLNLASYDEMFSRIKESYHNPARLRAGTDGIDWDGRQVKLRPRVESAPNMEDVRATMEEALATLDESHFAIIPGDLFHQMRDRTETNGSTSSDQFAEPGSVGIHPRIVDGVPIVAIIDTMSPAHRAGVQTGWVIEAVNDEEIETASAQMFKSLGSGPMSKVRVNEWIESRLIQPVGESVRISFRSLQGTTKTLRLKSQSQPGMWASFGNLPAMNLRYSSRRLPGSIGYFSLSVFLNPPKVMPAYSQFVRENTNANGIVIDLRGNPGGLGAMATGMCGFLIGEDGKKLGTMVRRDGNLQFVVNPRYPQFAGPVAVLVDEMSMSTSEIFAGGLQDLGRARVFGQPTPGAALPSTIMRLPNGDGLQYALADYVSASGRRLEGKGIQPDVIVPLRRESLEAGQDEVLDAACNWIAEQLSADDSTTQLTAPE